MSAREISIAFQTDKSPREYIALAQLVNRYAFDRVSVYCDAPYHPSYGPLLLMAPHLRRARLGPAAVSPYRIHPIDIAANTALLAEAAPGGVYIGLARGAWLAEHGIREPEAAIEGIGEAIAIIRKLLAGESAGYSGKVFNLAAHVRAPYPLPAGSIPIMIGTWGQKLARLAGGLADEVKVGGSANPAMVAQIRRWIAAGEAEAGRAAGSVGVALGAVTVVDEDRQLARQLARQAVALYLPVVAPLDRSISVDPELLARISEHVRQRELEAASRLISDELLDLFAFSGSPADLIEQSARLYEAGVQRIEYGTPHGLDAGRGVRDLGEKVLPGLGFSR